jgi:hypothetical protein
VLEAESARAVRSHGVDFGILELLWTYRDREASDDRDRIFALYGLLRGHFAVARNYPNYDQDVRQTFIDVTTKLLKVTLSTTALVGASMKSAEYSDLPSWVQDWSYKGDTASRTALYTFYAIAKTFNSAGSSSGMRATEPQLVGRVLELRGFQVDEVLEVGTKVVENCSEAEMEFKSTIQSWRSLAESSGVNAIMHKQLDKNFETVLVAHSTLEALWRTI